ncbi:MAG: metallophosphoesterase family protein [Bacteroidales bacterium]|nr:metallophosphoesterase family protein [Bacteroidales bacterium]
MKTIGLLSDTHSYIEPKILDFFKDVDEIWHAGDIGSMEVVNILESFKPLRAVYGNIDNHQIRSCFGEILEFECEQIKVLLIHIGGYPGHYDKKVRNLLSEKSFDLFVCGHSHILKMMYDKKHEMMHMNPGAAGKSGFHLKKTALKFKVEGNLLKDMQIFEMDR